ncbi:MAG TPA: glycosyltransferase [Candidatus Binatia bacterium]|nr:glycosyltransferase [Candidatus Binatia bacterium]
MTLRVLELSFMYPSPRHPNSGVFIEQSVREIARRVVVEVVSPVPWVPPPLAGLAPRWRAYRSQPRETWCHGVRVHHPRYVQPLGRWSIPLAGVTMAAGVRALATRIAAGGVDVIHAHQLLPDGLAGLLLGRWLRRPVVCTLHGSDVTELPFHGPAALAAARGVARGVQAFTAASANLVEALARVAADHAPASVVPYGVDLERFAAHDRLAARGRLGIPGREPVVLYAGLLIARKGVDVLLDAFARVAREVPGVRLLLVGGSGERDDRRADLVRRVAALGCTGRVVFLGRRPHHEMPLWLSAADVFAFPSRLEGSPNVVREAVACGTPVVVTALPGIADVVGPDSGLVVPIDDPDALAGALVEALGRRWDRAAIRRRATAWRWDANAEATLEVLVAASGAAARRVA